MLISYVAYVEIVAENILVLPEEKITEQLYSKPPPQPNCK